MTVTIGRRELLAALGGAAVAWPLAARAQQPGKLPTVGFLASGTPSSHTRWVTTFVQRLSELGWIEGRTVAIEVRWAEGRSDHAAEIAADFVRLKVDVVVTTGTPTTLAAKQATTVIPIVFVAASDPVADNLVASLARPGGNMTGVSNQARDLAGKRLELLREVVPGLRRLAILVNVGNSAAVAEMGEVQAAAGTLGLAVATLEIRRAASTNCLKGPADTQLRNPITGIADCCALSGHDVRRRQRYREPNVTFAEPRRGHLARLRGAQRSRGRTLCPRGPADDRQPNCHQHLGARGATADDIHL